MNFEEKLSFLKSKEMIKYLDYYKDFQIEKNKCLKKKKCSDKYTETSEYLIIERKGKEKIVKKPEYIFIKNKKDEIKLELKNLEEKIKNFKFIVNYDTSKKTHSEFTSIKDKFLNKKNELDELNLFLEKANNTKEKKEKIIDLKLSIMEKENIRRNLFFEINQETDNETKKIKILEYLDNKEIKKQKEELNNLLNEDSIEYIVNKLPVFDVKETTKIKKEEEILETKEKEDDTKKIKKKKIIKRCPKGERRNKKTGECEKKLI